ncbi:MAG: aspartate/tyrosine/aromatic aminotransferase [Planctomycetales bacterium]|nr:aspartate/tyrosine/aromatic aminotransferase [Planctomycetales bacterium]
MFERIDPAPPDAILGLTEAFRNDTNPRKVNLSVGQYEDENGKTPILPAVREAERRILETSSTKGYLPMDGDATYGAAVRNLLLGEDHPAIAEKRVATSQTPGGTGGLRVAADFASTTLGISRVWLTNPTWPNHPSIFEAAGMEAVSFAYYDAKNHGLDAEAMLADLQQVRAGEMVVLHGCCHNPTGVDLSVEHWDALGELLASRGAIPLVDFAYQGFAESLEADAVGVRRFLQHIPDALICSSFSKNFGLYRERVGALTLVGQTAAATSAAQSWVKKAIRVLYSNPPYHGAAIVATVLNDAELRAQWVEELAEMRNRIQDIRQQFASEMAKLAPGYDFTFIPRQRGMFSFSGLTAEHVDRLRSEHSVYIVRNGRINIAGLNKANVDYVCQAIAAVLS